MSVNKKHLATFLFGAAAGVALHKYMQTEEGKEVVENLKSKGEQFRKDAESTMDKAPEYFDKLKTEASGSLNEVFSKLKQTFPDAEKLLGDLFGGAKNIETKAADAAETVVDTAAEVIEDKKPNA